MKYLILALTGFLILVGCASTSLKPVMTEGFKFEDDERRLWVHAEKEQRVLDKSGFIYRDEALDAYLNAIARKLQPPEVLARVPFKILVLKNPFLNAFTMPNGAIYMHTGMLARMENEAQLATILGHEMIHATHRHGVKGFRDIKNKTAFLATIQVAFGGLGGGIGELVSMLGSIGTLAAVTGYSRELETEADMEGIKLIIEAGYDPTESPKVFELFKQELEEEKIKEPFFFGSHPRLQERLDNYKNFFETQKPEGGVKNTEVFLEKTHKVVLENVYLDLKAGRFKIARMGTEKYLTLKPDDARGYYLLGEIFRQKGEKGDTEKAIEYYQKAITIDSSYPDPHKGIGLIYYKQGEKILARKFLESYLTLSQNAFDRAYIEEYIEQCKTGGEE